MSAADFEILGQETPDEEELEIINEILEGKYHDAADDISQITKVKVRLNVKWNKPKYDENDICYVYTAKIKNRRYILNTVKDVMSPLWKNTFEYKYAELIAGMVEKWEEEGFRYYP